MGSISIVYYSGTGSTEYVANTLYHQLVKNNYHVDLNVLNEKNRSLQINGDVLFLLYPIHASNAPHFVYEWINNLNKGNQKKVYLLSVSGGGAIGYNLGAHYKTIKLLDKKGYKVIYEQMLIMPSNFAVVTNEYLSLRLLEILPLKIEEIINDFENDIKRRIDIKNRHKFISTISQLETYGGRIFGSNLKVSNTCTMCGQCIRECPANNIAIKDNKIRFDGNCHFCLKCIYQCPNNAITPKYGKFVIIKEGYNIQTMINKLPITEDNDIIKLTSNKAWIGLRPYLDSSIKR